jgi:hypothetical protein
MAEQKQLAFEPEPKNADDAKNQNYPHPLWLSISESAKLGGVTAKTIRRAIQSKQVKFKIIKNRYLVALDSVLRYLAAKKKLQNKLNQYGLGQYVEKWK